MIHQLDIAHFGSFDGFYWKSSIRDTPGNNVQNFKKLNILYGRNYSGKTTLSRIFRSLEKGEIPWRYEAASFALRGEQGELNHEQLIGHSYDIRVYNRDFVAENLSFLTNQRDGNIQTFAIVGSENNAVAERIAELQASLGSRISLMPEYLKKYVTEFNYLFHQIYRCSIQVQQGDNHDHFFSFGNNLRKFFEAYLYFKYPHGTGRDAATERVMKFFAGDEMAGKIATRLSNELSHLEESLDRGMSPIDIPEIQKIAAHVLEKIKTADPDQYESLMASIGVPIQANAK